MKGFVGTLMDAYASDRIGEGFYQQNSDIEVSIRKLFPAKLCFFKLPGFFQINGVPKFFALLSI